MFRETGKTREDDGNTQMLAKREKAPMYHTPLVSGGDMGADGHDDSRTLLGHVTGLGEIYTEAPVEWEGGRKIWSSKCQVMGDDEALVFRGGGA